MMQSAGLERAAQVIAENAVAAFEHERDGAGFHPTGRATAVAALVRHLLAVMPTEASEVLAAACNRGLDEVAGAVGLGGPRVEAVDLADGSVTMRAP